jgi:hypothetical protein
MTHRRVPRRIALASASTGARAAALACAVVLAAAACTASGASPSPAPEATAVVALPVVATPGASAAAPPTNAAAGRTTTGWGEIWDAVPATFPLPAGVSAADLPDGPFSGTFTASAAAAATASAIADGLRAGGYPTVDAGAPAEDGSVTIDASGSAAGCRVQVSVRPLGGLTAIEILYGSGCPVP